MSTYGDMTEREGVEYVASLYRLEADPDHDRTMVYLGPATAFVLISALQLAIRHPDMSDQIRGYLTVIIDQLRPLFSGTPGAFLLQLGDHPVYDIPTACEYPAGPHAPGCPEGDHLPFGMPGGQS